MKKELLIKDTNRSLYEIANASSFDLLVSNVIKMMKVGMSVQQDDFDSIDINKVKQGNYITGYKYHVGLYDELISIYENITQSMGKKETLNKW